MDKISGIIPTSSRVAAVDLKDSTVRPGAPAFGRNQGSSALKPVPVSVPTNEGGETMRKATEMFSTQNDWRSRDSRQAAVAQEVSNNFFMKKAISEQEPIVAAVSEAPLQQPEGLYPRGFFIDRTA